MSTIEQVALPNVELRSLAASFLADRAAWEPLVRATPERRHYELLRSDEDVTVWLISWMTGHDTGYHDHDVSSGAIAVARGSVREERLRIGGAPESRLHRAGEIVTFEAHDIHRVSHVEGEPAVTIHVYSPALTRSGAYVFDPSGALRRRSLPAHEELRPQPVYGAFASRAATAL